MVVYLKNNLRIYIISIKTILLIRNKLFLIFTDQAKKFAPYQNNLEQHIACEKIFAPEGL